MEDCCSVDYATRYGLAARTGLDAVSLYEYDCYKGNFLKQNLTTNQETGSQYVRTSPVGGHQVSFGNEIQFEIPLETFASYYTKFYLKITMPVIDWSSLSGDVDEKGYVANLGYAILNYVKLQWGGDEKLLLEGDWFFIQNECFLTKKKKNYDLYLQELLQSTPIETDAYKVPYLNTKPFDLYVDISAIFNVISPKTLDYFNILKIRNENNRAIILKVGLRKIGELIKSNNTTLPSDFVTPYLDMSLIYRETVIKYNNIINNDTDFKLGIFRIVQHLKNTDYQFKGNNTELITLDGMSGLVESFFVMVRTTSNLDENQKTGNKRYVLKDSNNKPFVKNIKIFIKGKAYGDLSYTKLTNINFNTFYDTNITYDIYLLSACTKYYDFQPSGHVNFDRLSSGDAYLELTFFESNPEANIIDVYATKWTGPPPPAIDTESESDEEEPYVRPGMWPGVAQD